MQPHKFLSLSGRTRRLHLHVHVWAAGATGRTIGIAPSRTHKPNAKSDHGVPRREGRSWRARSPRALPGAVQPRPRRGVGEERVRVSTFDQRGSLIHEAAVCVDAGRIGERGVRQAERFALEAALDIGGGGRVGECEVCTREGAREELREGEGVAAEEGNSEARREASCRCTRERSVERSRSDVLRPRPGGEWAPKLPGVGGGAIEPSRPSWCAARVPGERNSEASELSTPSRRWWRLVAFTYATSAVGLESILRYLRGRALRTARALSCARGCGHGRARVCGRQRLCKGAPPCKPAVQEAPVDPRGSAEGLERFLRHTR